MNRSLVNLLLGGALVVTLGLGLMIEDDHRLPNRLFLPNMNASPAYGAYEEGPLAKGERRTKEAGQWSGGLYLTPDSIGLKASTALTNPLNKDSLMDYSQAGAFVYRDFCLPCHGPNGAGDGPVALRGYPPPPNLIAPAANALTDGQIYHIITFGKGNMPAYAAQMTDYERWLAVMHLRRLQ
ncbi:MAG: cytochrome c [Calditrichaeota bacterium]|nr:cytochrome c [Calditrichota bacterium]